jgi:hypothetical protein
VEGGGRKVEGGRWREEGKGRKVKGGRRKRRKKEWEIAKWRNDFRGCCIFKSRKSAKDCPRTIFQFAQIK